MQAEWMGGPFDGRQVKLPDGTQAVTTDREIGPETDRLTAGNPKWHVPVEAGRILWSKRKEATDGQA